MKVLYRIPTRQYAYIEIEDDVESSDESIIKRYFELEMEYRKQANELNNKGKLKTDIFDEGLDKLIK